MAKIACTTEVVVRWPRDWTLPPVKRPWRHAMSATTRPKKGALDMPIQNWSSGTDMRRRSTK